MSLIWTRPWVVGLVALLVALAGTVGRPGVAGACCPAPPSGKAVVNADQTVILVWDAATRTEHLIRRASFKSGADDFGFLIPTPAKPELDESGEAAFPALAKITAPKVIKKAAPSAGCSGCFSRSMAVKSAAPERAASVTVLDEKTVAGFDAVVLEASSTGALLGWLQKNGYAFSPEVEAWAKPYVEGGWKITALKVTKDAGARESAKVSASSLRLSFHSERPLFPYREPDSGKAASALGANDRLLRIYFLSDARYDGELTKEAAWTGAAAWAGKLSPADRDQTLAALRLPATALPPETWLTELEDHWPYKVAPADLYFSRSKDQAPLERPPIIEYTAARERDASSLAFAFVLALPFVVHLRRRRSSRE